MNSVALGALLGLFGATGLLVAIAYSPPMRRVRLDDRLAPYLRARQPSSNLAQSDETLHLWGVPLAVLRPALERGAAMMERSLGGSRSVQRRLSALGSSASVEDFRVEQLVWGVVGFVMGGLSSVLLSIAASSVSLIALIVLAIAGFLAGALGYDWWLSMRVRRREQDMLAEFPIVAEFLALAVTAGEAPLAALERVCRLCGGELSKELKIVISNTREGVTLPAALERLSKRTSLPPLARFVDGVAIALERGTPLAELLRAQAADVREAGKRALLAAGGRKEILMMVPVVFLILPVTVLFALYPGLASITVLTQ